MAWNQDQNNCCNEGYPKGLGFRGGDDEINPKPYLKNPNRKSIGIWGGDDEIKAKGGPQVEGFSNSNFNNRFDVGESRLAKIKAKISVEDFDYLKGFANSNKRIDVDDPRLAKIRAKISEEDVDYLKGFANSNFKGRFGVDNPCNGSFGFFDNNNGKICVIL
ncbi:hypothetical protein Pyn_39499 [Prunus yedoensis var. nudiflora]|uniref:Uncharacterized protein n=1 Tax=Prunus yedoensis var. nudiflora TaxID=2094558 RepID=A0A314YDP6_PRUYE|nr:hypothetical protein Pyn_39499 [Prunus yedoensis var. nudiflora]